ncbi:acyl-CoA dehydrogenase family protein [Phyllobacterium pellucidum]|uniref:acyl-CoA dehydrogenase family protein n=1 Tax=Phyllobacterium pellucidum TaxID=2740464 RepID=UPI001D14221E|nr:acyl-CoA dehydrogenase family protein [Phyllobacterium sp. T1018]UGY10934.1 acyl-CoA dehydrogenase family protein [Phyllobacterium sp. T1018]
MYRAPVEEIIYTLRVTAGLDAALEQGRFGDLSGDLVDAIVEEAGRFASTRVAPLLEVGDKHGTPLKDGEVTTPPGWKEVYREWIGGGWNALTGPEEFGGQGLPMMLAIATFEMWNSGSMAFGIGPTLTLGAIEALEAHAADDLRHLYLPKLVSGEWMGTMNLTEPQAGSDVGALRTRAERAEDGTYRIFGSKIFITYGEHDLTDNIVHLVLARLPDAPQGTKGISLFLVPKVLVNKDGSLGARNDVFCGGVEHKMGIHGSPTCTMIYGDGFAKDREPGAVGWLIGEENRGLACMFTMMNNARLAVGIQGVAVAETAYQKALAYAEDRRQMRAPGWKGEGMSPIVEHPDVQRNLLTMKGLAGAARAIAYACAHAIDMAKTGEGDEARFWSDRANLLTPVAKAFSTDIGVDVASIGIQVHGGMGYIEETGAAQLLRDARIAPIYEGTNGIQAIDLVQRKLSLAGGQHFAGYIAELREIAEAVNASNSIEFGETAKRLSGGLDDLAEAGTWLQAAIAEGRVSDAFAGATPFLRLFGLAAGASYLSKAALGGNNAGRSALARFFAENLLAETAALKDRVIHGAASLLAARTALS